MKHCAPNTSVWYCSGNGIINYKFPDLDRVSFFFKKQLHTFDSNCKLPPRLLLTFLPSFLHASNLTFNSLTAPHNFFKNKFNSQLTTHNFHKKQIQQPTHFKPHTHTNHKPQLQISTHLKPTHFKPHHLTSHPNRNPKSTKPTKNAASNPNHHRCSHRGASASGGSR